MACAPSFGRENKIPCCGTGFLLNAKRLPTILPSLKIIAKVSVPGQFIIAIEAKKVYILNLAI